MAYNTGNPSGSSDPRDLSDSSADIDTWATSTTADTHPDRLGVQRKTWHGMENEFDAVQTDRAQRFDLFLANSGYQFVGDYATGIELTEYNQVVRDVSGNLWRVSASTSLPYTTTGAGLPESGAFIAIGDADLAQNLISDPLTGQGALLVRGSVIYVDTIADLQSLPTSELVDGQAALVSGTPFKYDGAWFPSAGFVTVEAFGAVADGVTDISGSVHDAQAFGDYTLVFSKGVYYIGTHLIIRNHLRVEPAATLKADWTPTSWLTIYKNGANPILPEWFGADTESAQDATNATVNANAIQAALDCVIDISIDPIGVVADPNHGSYNSGAIAINGSKQYYIGGNRLLIRSEHHFLGLYIFDPASPHYAGGIIGDKTNDIFFVEEALNTSSTGAQTNKIFERVGIRRGTNGINFEKRGDQSLHVKGCRFGEITGACVKGSNLFNLHVVDNYFGDCAGGWLVDLTAVNSVWVSGNVTGESTNPSKGIRINSGESQGANTVTDNRLRSGHLIFTESAADDGNKHIVSNNSLMRVTDQYFTYGMNIDVRDNADVSGNTVTFGSKTGAADLKGISIREGNIRGGGVKGPFDVGIELIIGGDIDVPVHGANTGILFTSTSGNRANIKPTIKSCTTGINCNIGFTHILGGLIHNCTTGIDGGSNFRFGLIESVTFTANTTDHTIYNPGADREAEITQIKDCLYPEIAETHKVRSGIDKLAFVTGIYRSTAPIGGTWKTGDVFVSGGGLFRCTASGTPGTWVNSA